MPIERDIGVLQEQGRWLAAKVETIDGKLDRLLKIETKEAFSKGKLVGGITVISIITSALVHILAGIF